MNNPEIQSIYDFFITDYLKELNTLPLSNQLLECRNYKILILDFCGVSPKYFKLFSDCDIYLVESQNDEQIVNLCKEYDLVYFLIYQLQQITIYWPAIKIVCLRNKIVETVI